MNKILPLLVVFFLTSCALEKPIQLVEVDMYNDVGDSLGIIKISEDTNGVKLDIDLQGLPPGEHAMHFHEKGICEPPDFVSAGNHFNPTEKEHGLLHPEGAHAGDLKNLIVEDDGKVKVEFEVPELTLQQGDTSLFTKEGTAIIIHENKDDGMSQPAGDAGKRIACGEVKEEEATDEDNKPKEGEEQNDLGKEEK